MANTMAMAMSMTLVSPVVSASLHAPSLEQYRIAAPSSSASSKSWTGLRQIAGPTKQAARRQALSPAGRGGQISCSLKNAEQLVRDGKVRCTWTYQAQELVNNEGYRVLDVRPEWEHERASSPAFLHVPVFIAEDRVSLLTLVRGAATVGFGGLWTGQRLTRRNENFVAEVLKVVPDKAAPLIVCCSEGLRSLLAVEELYTAGFTNVAWMYGGFNVSQEVDFPGVVGDTKLQYSSLGGVSSILIKANWAAQNAFDNVRNAIVQK